jgi:5S rRNA maturation endonuclease (ribonuclease M5)
VVSNLIIVESHNDQYFLQVLIDHLKLNIEVGMPVCSVDDFECLGGLSEKRLIQSLNEIKSKIEKENYQKIGVLVDADEVGIDERVALVQRAMTAAGADVTPNAINTLTSCPAWEVELAIGITHFEGNGELETLLKKIKNQDSTYANCLEAWKQCLDKQGKTIKQKDFDKFWLNNYFRYDTCSEHEQEQAGRKCTKQAAFEKAGIWDLEHSALDDLKTFLRLFAL